MPPSLTSLQTPNTSLSGPSPESATHFPDLRVTSEILAWLRDAFDDAHVDAELADAGDQVLASLTVRGRGKQSGLETTREFWQVWTFRDGKAVHGRGFLDRAKALEAAGLEE